MTELLWEELLVRKEESQDTKVGFPGGASGKETICQCRRPKGCGFDLWVRKMPWRMAWQSIPVFLLENPMDKGAWWAMVHRVAQSWTQPKQP